LEGIDEMTLKQVFLRWMEHHIWCITVNGDYVK
jgi:hypothetical protein